MLLRDYVKREGLMRLVSGRTCLAELMTVLVMLCAGSVSAQLTAGLVNFEFENVLINSDSNPASDKSSSVYLYSGNVGPYKAAGGPDSTITPFAADTGIKLEESGFGSMFAGDVPYAEFVDDIIIQAQRMLYQDAQGITDADKAIAAFRYLTKLYGFDPSSASLSAGGENLKDANSDANAELMAASEAQLRSLAATPVQTMDEILANVPDSVELTREELAGLEHRRKVTQRKIDYAKNVLADRAAGRSKQVNKAVGDAATVRCNFETIVDLYGSAERTRANQALILLQTALKHAPFNTKLVNAYLDVFYDKSIAELQYIKQKKVERSRYRLGLQVVSPTKFVIDQEIEILRDQILPQYESALVNLSNLLKERGGVNVAAISNEAPGTPLGYYLLKREQPVRNKLAAKWTDESGIIQTVPQYNPFTTQTDENRTSQVLFQGYKDYVLIMTILSDYMHDAAELARLYGMRGSRTPTVDDYTSASALISHVQQNAMVDARYMDAMFANFNPPPGDASGINAARQGVATSLGELEGVRGFLAGEKNPLGFNKDFLILIKEFPDSTSGNQFDSFDALIRWIRNTATSPLSFAEITYNEAKISYETFRANADQMFNETGDIEGALADRYFEIIGAEPDSSDFTILNPAVGSELEEVRRNITQVGTKIGLLRSLNDQITSDVQNATTFKNVTVPGYRAGIDTALNTYLSQSTSAYDDIYHWSAAAAASQATFDMVAGVGGIAGGASNPVQGAIAGAVVGVAGVANIATQTIAAQKQADAEEKLDKASASYDADMAKLDATLTANDAASELASLQREQIGASVEFQSVNDELAQERARETNLLREVTRIKQQAEESLNSLNDRYFADPVHQIRTESDSLRADAAFNDAQRWVFYTLRALEYKWNKPFQIRSGNKDYDLGSLYKIRNFIELRDLIVAMEQFNTINLIGFTREPFVDKLSLKKDFFGYLDGTLYAVTNQAGTSETVTAAEAFKRRLRSLRNSSGNLQIPLDTVGMRKDEGIFFEGPQYEANGHVFSAGKYLDKIEWFKFVVVSPVAPKVVTGAYSYGGTSYIRTRVPPCRDPNNDTTIRGEYEAYPFRYFLTLDNGATWIQRLSQEDTVKIVFQNTTGEPLDTAENPFYRNTFLKERSVAATQQVLKIHSSKIDVDTVQDIEIYVRHLFVSRDVPECTN